MTLTQPTPQPNRNSKSSSAIAPSLEHPYEGLQVYNESGPELDLRNQPPLELVYRQPSNAGLQHDPSPLQQQKARPHNLRRSTIFLLVALVTVVIGTAIVGCIVGRLVKKEKANATSDSKHTSVINNGTVIFSRTTVFAQQSGSRKTTSSSSLSISSSSSSSPSSSSSSSASFSSFSSSSFSSSSTSSPSPSSDEGSPTITTGPSETYSIQSSPILTLSRDCPGSNGTTIVTPDDPHQSFIKNCNWRYNKAEPSGDAFRSPTSTLDACISLCAAQNSLQPNATLGYCTAVEWRWSLSEDSAGFCYGMVDQQAGMGEPSLDGEIAPVDAAFFLGWSQ